VQGLAFGLGTHLSLYTWQRLFLRQKPQLPYIHDLHPNKNTTSATQPIHHTSDNSTAQTSAPPTAA